MRLKTYFASSVEAAMLLALEQLGPEAMIVNSRTTSPENRHLGEYEVVFATEPEAKLVEEKSTPLSTAPSISEIEAESVRRLHGEVSRLASEIESLSRAMKRAEVKQTVSNFEGEAADVVHLLREAGFDEEFILELVSGVSPDGGSLRFRVLQLLAERLKTAPSLGRTGYGRKVVALVGPAGTGKSTLIAKLATRFGVAARRPCQILSLDSDRIGAAEPLRMTAGVLGVGFRLLEESSMLAGAMDSLRDRDLIFIDTPGFARDEQDSAARLAEALSSRQEIDVQLVLPASMKRRDLDRAMRAYRHFNPGKIIFTRLDETEQIGTAIGTAVACDLPVSFLSSGPRVPEDLESANGAQLARRVFLPATAAGGAFSRGAAA